MNIYKAIFFFFPLFSFFFRRPSMVSRACTETMCGARHRRDDEQKKTGSSKKKYMCNYEAFGTESRYKCDYTFPRTQFSIGFGWGFMWIVYMETRNMLLQRFFQYVIPPHAQLLFVSFVSFFIWHGKIVFLLIFFPSILSWSHPTPLLE